MDRLRTDLLGTCTDTSEAGPTDQMWKRQNRGGFEMSSSANQDTNSFGERESHLAAPRSPPHGTSLHSSFDATLLEASNQDASHFDGLSAFSSSWDEGEMSCNNVSARKDNVVLPPQSTRKLKKRTTLGREWSAKTPSRVFLRQPGSCMKKPNASDTPSSAVKRRLAPLPQRRTPMRRIGSSSTPLTSASSSANVVSTETRTPKFAPLPLSSAIKSLSTKATAASTHVPSSIEPSSPASTRFRFTSFPASLPRIHSTRGRSCPNSSVRKRIDTCFADEEDGDNPDQSREDDGTHNTSISSLSADGHQQTNFRMTTANKHLLLGRRDGECDIDDVDEEPISPAHDAMGRTRLNFNCLLSPPCQRTTRKQDSILSLGLNLDLHKPYDQKRTNSFPSTLSSTTITNNISHYDESENALTPLRTSRQQIPQTPREVQLHFELQSAEFSPIPSVADDDNLCGSKLLPQEPFGFDMSIGDKPSVSRSTSLQIEDPEDKSVSLNSLSTNGKLRKLRPMPDISAFDSGPPSQSLDDSSMSESKGASSPRLLCPPTPIRTPAWISENARHPFFGSRQNSLIATKVLLSCPSQILEGRTSLESSILDESKESLRASREQSGASEAPISWEDLPKSSNGAVSSDSDSNPSEGSAESSARSSSAELSRSVVSFNSDFETLRLLGSGAFADVYKVRSKTDKKLYAVKKNRRQFRGKRDRDLALGEVQYMQRLQRAGVEDDDNCLSKRTNSLYLLFFIRAWQEDGYFFCQTELCCRDSCRKMLDSLHSDWAFSRVRYPSLVRNALRPILPVRNDKSGLDNDDIGRLVPNETVWKICHDVAAGLSHIHAHGLVHYDIKPSNIFFVPHVRFGAMCKIGDFGLAGNIGTVGDGLEGDARYMPPLLSSGVRHPSSDIFSLGLTLYEVASDLVDILPSEGPLWHELRSGCNLKLPLNREVGLVALIRQMMSPSAFQRPTAESILNHSKVASFGANRDYFLEEYIQDIEAYDKREEERFANNNQEDQTPRNGLSRLNTIRSPPVLPMPPTFFSPAAAVRPVR